MKRAVVCSAVMNKCDASSKNHDVEADWTLNTLCNFKCVYCFEHSKSEHPAVGKIPVWEIIEFFDNTGLTWLTHITGGEPFLYPDFVDLCLGLTSKHFISVNTNLCSKNVFVFAKSVNPSRVSFVHCGLHIIQREKENLVDDFIAKVLFLNDKGYHTFVSYVMYPPLFKRFEKDYEFFNSKGIVILPKAFRGIYEGKRYPESYTLEEKKRFVHYSTEALDRSGYLASDEKPTIDLSLDPRILKGIPDFRGKYCLAGKSFVSIKPSGIIYRCGEKHVLGNLFESKLALFDQARKCDDHYCPYFCFKYSRGFGLDLGIK